MALESIAQLFTISTGVVIALAAILAFVVQRARYKREVEPDLRFEDCQVLAQYSQAGELRMTIQTHVMNHSTARAFNLALEARMDFASTSTEVGFETKGSKDWNQASRCAELHPGVSVEMRIDCLAAVDPSDADDYAMGAALTGATSHGTLSLNYQGEADIAHWLMTLRRRFSHRHTRPIAAYVVERNEENERRRARAPQGVAVPGLEFAIEFAGLASSSD
ncbi:MAG: hypothetical protein V3S98_01015 [Dehalococcoidia bacterium]